MAPTNEDQKKRAETWRVMLDYARSLPPIRCQYIAPEADDTPKSPRKLRIGPVHARKMRKAGAR